MKTFTETLNGTLWGLMRWGQWEELRAHIAGCGEPWYLYAPGEALPEKPLAGARLKLALEALDALLRKDHQDEHLGIIYTDDIPSPSLVKIYDPHAMGGCGGGKGIPPGWVLSTMSPALIETGPVRPENRKRWWRELQERLEGNP